MERVKLHRPDQAERKHYIPSKKVEVLLHPHLIYVGELDVSKGERQRHWSERLHSHPFIEVLLVTKGQGKVTIAGTDYSVSPGKCLVYNQGVEHREMSSVEAPLAAFYFAVKNVRIGNMDTNVFIAPGLSPMIDVQDDLPMLESHFANLIRETRNAGHYAKEITESLTRLILILLLRKLPFDDSIHSAQSGLFNKACQFIDDNYTEITGIEEICKQFRISRYYLMHLFKQYGEKPPFQRIISKRMELARHLLASTDLSIPEIASHCGYEDEIYFSRIFQTHTKVSPVRFRKTLSGELTPSPEPQAPPQSPRQQ